MEISFDTKELREICRSSEVAERSLPQVVARALRVIVADLRAARSLAEFAAIERVGAAAAFVIALGEGFRIHIVSAHRTTPTTDGDFDASKVYRVKVLAIAGRDGD